MTDKLLTITSSPEMVRTKIFLMIFGPTEFNSVTFRLGSGAFASLGRIVLTLAPSF